MATLIRRNGFGQVEGNHLSMQQTGQIYAQRPAVPELTQLENGQFVKYTVNKKDGKEIVITDDVVTKNSSKYEIADTEWMMVFNEVKLYGDTYNETYKDYAMQAKNFTGGSGNFMTNQYNGKGEMVPRVIKTNIGDIFTTNTIGDAGSYRANNVGETLAVGDVVSPNAQGFLSATGDGTIEFTVIKEYTMADGQPAVKLQRTK